MAMGSEGAITCRAIKVMGPRKALSYEVQPTNDQECAKRYAKYVL
jgi:hypothetical protein